MPCAHSRVAVRREALRSTCLALAAMALALSGLAGCSGAKGPAPVLSASPEPAAPRPASRVQPSAGETAARTAEEMIGRPYRYGGSTPAGFDCSGLVVYSYASAGVSGLPRTAARLEQAARPVPLGALERGDLLFFRLGGRKTHHVAMYVGDRAFVHAPSGGKRVERVSFDHVYWSRRLQRAGRLTR